MNPEELIKKAISSGRTTLNEAEAKALLACYGVPVVEESVSFSPDEAAAKAEAMGFPVVLKGLSALLTHKTEHGLVKIGLTKGEDVRRAAKEMALKVEKDLEGWVLQPLLEGRREFVAGMFRDHEFGPVIMFGLGGVFAEALNNVAFRIAPLDENQAEQMLDETAAKNLLTDFRGEATVDRERLITLLMGLSRLCEEYPAVAEIDINPLLVTSKGDPIAVDALIVLEEERRKPLEHPAIDAGALSALFEPNSVAFVGATSRFRKWGQLLFTNAIAGGYDGKVYLVNPNTESIAGRPAYKSVGDIPGPVDLAVVTIPASKALDLMPELGAKNVKAMLLITSGFGETGAEGRMLESRLVEEARENGILVLGPNTMGMCNPYHKFYCMGSHIRPMSGGTAFVSQSGNVGTQLLAFADKQSIGIRAFVGSGNEAMFTAEDALAYFGRDDLTSTILLYAEGVKNGRRFFETARQVSCKKPIVLMKGGRTHAGEKAAATHTGALASNARVFETVCRQAGIISVTEPMDVLDLSAGFSSLPLPAGKRVAIMTLGGGWGVVTADLCNEHGLEVPELTPEIIRRIDQYLPPFWSRSNPVDLVGENEPSLALKVLKELLCWDGCDAVINLGTTIGRSFLLGKVIESTVLTDPAVDRNYLDSVNQSQIDFESEYMGQTVSVMEAYGKPVVGASMFIGEGKQTVTDVGGRYKAMFFQTPERAVKVLANMYKYQNWLTREKEMGEASDY